MTSKERHEARYIRRKTKRDTKREEVAKRYDDFDKVFSYQNLYASYRRRRRNVAWKASIQRYISDAPTNVYTTFKKLNSDKWRPRGYYGFDICERGKLRHIQAVRIGERVVYGCLCENSLMPLLGRSFIYDNSASQVGKGYHFAMRRLQENLRSYIRKNGTDGYILLFDFKSFFDSIDHDVCKKIARRTYKDRRIIKTIDGVIDSFGTVGLGLGSPVSQVFALAVPSRIDHYVKEMLRIKRYGRYMDDGYLIHESKQYLKYCLSKIKEICKTLGLTINQKKTHIVKLSHGFTWLKCRFRITTTGHIIKKMCKTSVARMRRRIKRLKSYIERGKITKDDIRQALQSWLSYASHFDSFRSQQNIKNLVYTLYGVNV